jgi:hypothetical protein
MEKPSRWGDTETERNDRRSVETVFERGGSLRWELSPSGGRYYRRLVLYYIQEARRWRWATRTIADLGTTTSNADEKWNPARAVLDEQAPRLGAEMDAEYDCWLRRHGGKG